MSKKMEYKVLPVRIDVKSYNELRSFAYANHISMADIMRRGLDLLLAESKRPLLTKRDIAI